MNAVSQLVSKLEVTEKSYKQADGTAIVAHMIRMGDQDFLTVADTAAAFGTTESGIRARVAEHGLVALKASDQVLGSLRLEGVIPLKTTVVSLLPRDTIDALVRIINTDEAKAAYRQIIGEWRDSKHGTVNNAALEQLAKGVSFAAQAAADAGKMSLQLDARLTVTEQVVEDAMLTSLQITELHKEACRCASRVGFKPGAIFTQIKQRFLPPGTALSVRTFKEIPRSTFDAAVEFCRTWEPNRSR